MLEALKEPIQNIEQKLFIMRIWMKEISKLKNNHYALLLKDVLDEQNCNKVRTSKSAIVCPAMTPCLIV